MHLTLTVVTQPDGSAFVPVGAVAGALGASEDFVFNRAPAHKCRITEAGDLRGFEFAEGVRLIHKLRAEMDDHSSRWGRYVAHREEVKRATAEKRAAEMAAAQDAERQRQQKMAKRMKEVAAREAEQAAIEAAARRAEREGVVVEFERWAG